MELNDTYTLVIYSDGASNPNPGFYGCGVHGYLYRKEDMGVKTSDQPNGNIITSVGYLEKELVSRTDHTIVKPVAYLNLSGSYPGTGTNNMGEILGFLETVAMVKAEKISLNKLVFMTDSTYVLSILKHVRNDTSRNWDNPDRPNLSLWYRVEKDIKWLNENDIRLTAVKVKAHTTVLGNNLADRLAFLGRYKTSMGTTGLVYDIRPSSKYWKPTPVRHPLIDFKQLFFNSAQRVASSENMYTVMDYKRDVEVGKKSNEAMFCVALLAEPVVLVDSAINAHMKLMRSLSILATINLRELYSQNHLLHLDIFGRDVYTTNHRNHTVSVLEERILASNINPPGLANQAMTKTTHIYNILKEYKDNPVGNVIRSFIDVTSTFFTENDKGKTVTVLSPVAKTVTVETTYKGNELKVPIELGKDILDRNHLKKLEKLGTKVTMVIDEPVKDQLEYYFILDTTSNSDLAIYCNFYSNKVFVKPRK